MSNDCYVYTLAYPDGTVFYVGKGRGNRIDQHEREAKRGIQSYKCNVIRQIERDGSAIVKTKVCEHLSEDAAYQMEIDLIRMYGREHLTNLTDGGEGASYGNENALKNTRPRKLIGISGATLDMIYDALALEGNGDPSGEEIRDAVYYAVRQVYGRKMEDAQAIII
jgi:hypothetical protein